MTRIIEIETQEELDDLLKTDGSYALDFYATWCQPCKALSKYLSETPLDLGIIYKVDIGELDFEGVRSVPTVIKYDKGVEAGRLIGFNPTQLNELLDKA